jgi:hypothetical protein
MPRACSDCPILLTSVLIVGELDILQKKKSVQRVVRDVLYDDPDIREFDAILIQEPHYLQNCRKSIHYRRWS